MTLRVMLIIVSALLALGSATCLSSKEDKLVPIGPDVKANLVIYFNTGVTEGQINAFSQEVLSRQNPEGRGYKLRDGIGLQLRVFPSVQGHEAIAITFFSNATQTQREEVKVAVLSSPVVYKVLENVAPADVKKLE